jgi:hypothetical protein
LGNCEYLGRELARFSREAATVAVLRHNRGEETEEVLDFLSVEIMRICLSLSHKP